METVDIVIEHAQTTCDIPQDIIDIVKARFGQVEEESRWGGLRTLKTTGTITDLVGLAKDFRNRPEPLHIDWMDGDKLYITFGFEFEDY